MPRLGAVLSPPPLPFAAAEQNTLPQLGGENKSFNGGATTPSSTENLSPSIIVTVLILATVVIVSASLYLLIRFLGRQCCRHPSQIDAVDSLQHRRRHDQTDDAVNRHHRHNGSRRVLPEENSLVNSLPMFTFEAITSGNSSTKAGDCAVCLSKFEPHDQLRLLPLCCHAFHAGCIDTWLAANQTCPLCRSAIFVSECEVLSRITQISSSGHRSGSFRIEIGNVSGRRLLTDSGEHHQRSYSIGSFDYIVDDILSEITIPSTQRGSDYTGGDKSDSALREEEAALEPAPEAPGPRIAAEVAGGGRSWLRDYIDRLASATSLSLSSSVRSSGRFFTGSSRRTELLVSRDSDSEPSRLGDEIGEMFRWLSGV
ncbi:hypothetical protein Nepgr_019031 [Nepenthes gracilis]|uniref:RING-type E3 ubiquitin transferase n=1 Tax=Nepenthes gracilis TaxID=150966 RepID=A0AAD3XUU8_NEPGR|nr:hypothetical protein Nepgr_019031 [Nepenthes gracilis]